MKNEPTIMYILGLFSGIVLVLSIVLFYNILN